MDFTLNVDAEIVRGAAADDVDGLQSFKKEEVEGARDFGPKRAKVSITA